jgi:hypothetical protein
VRPGGESRRTAGILLVFGSLAVAGYLVFQVVLPARYLPATAGDFGNYYRAGAAVLAGKSPFNVPGFDYPPLLAFLAAPLALLPLEAARWIWFLGSEACLLGAAWLTWRWLGGDRVAGGAVLAVWCLAGTVPENLVLGQVNPLLLVLTAGALYSWDRRPGAAGALIGIATALKLWPAVLALGFLAGKRWRALALSAATAAALLAGPWLGIRIALPGPVAPATAGYWRGTPAPLNFSLPAVALRLAEPPRGSGPLPNTWVHGDDPQALRLSTANGALSVAVCLVTLLVGLTVLAASTRRRPAPGPPNRPLEERGLENRPPPDGPLPVTLLSLGLLAATLSWYHYQLLQLPGLAWLGARWWPGDGGRDGALDGARGPRRFIPLMGLALLGTGLTRGQTLFALYVEAFGWTARAPVLLWTVTALVPLLGALLFGLLVREARR